MDLTLDKGLLYLGAELISERLRKIREGNYTVSNKRMPGSSPQRMLTCCRTRDSILSYILVFFFELRDRATIIFNVMPCRPLILFEMPSQEDSDTDYDMYTMLEQCDTYTQCNRTVNNKVPITWSRA